MLAACRTRALSWPSGCRTTATIARPSSRVAAVDGGEEQVLAAQAGARPVGEGPVAVAEVRRGHRHQRREQLGRDRVDARRGVEQLEQADVDHEADRADDAEGAQLLQRDGRARRSASPGAGGGRHGRLYEAHGEAAVGPREASRRRPRPAAASVRASLAATMASPSIRRTGLPVVAMVGGGQLARMTHQAAIALGQSLRVLATGPADSAALVAADVRLGDHRDLDALRAARRRRHGAHLRPRARAHRAPARARGRRPPRGARSRTRWCTPRTSWSCAGRSPTAGEPQPAWARGGAPSHDVDRLRRRRTAGRSSSRPRAAATTGKGVFVVARPRRGAPTLLERARHAAGRAAGRHACASSPRRWPARRSARSPSGRSSRPCSATGSAPRCSPRPRASTTSWPTAAQELAVRIADRLGVVGMLAVELFETADGVLVNELAMRPHNSGHWTIEGSRTSQFEQHLRAVLDYPLGLDGDDRAGRGDGQRARRRGGRRRTGTGRASTSGCTT